MYLIIKYIPLQQGLRPGIPELKLFSFCIIKYIPLQQGLRQGEYCKMGVLDY